MLAPVFGWWLGKIKQRSDMMTKQIDNNDMLIEALECLVKVQKEGIRIQENRFRNDKINFLNHLKSSLRIDKENNLILNDPYIQQHIERQEKTIEELEKELAVTS